MNRWPSKPLGEVCALNPKLTSSEVPSPVTEVTFVPMAAVDEVAGTIARPELRPYSQVAKGYTPFANGDVLFAKITPCMQNGKAPVATGLRNGLGFGSTEFHVLRPKDAVLSRWVFHFVRRPQFRAAAEASFTGTAGQQRVPLSFMESSEIPVPPLTEQERIVGLLDEAEALRQRRQQADRRTAAFIPALFHEMFGDPGKKRKLVGLGELVRFVGGGTPSRACPEYFEGTIPWATSKDVKSDYMSDTQEHITEDAIEQSATNLVPARSVLIVVKSKILMHSLPIAITTVPMCFGQDLKALICGEKALPEFIVGCLSSQKQSILAKARGANTEGLTLEILRSVLIPLPPVRLQREFAERVGEVRALETAQAQSRQRLDALFAALLDRAFKGRL